MTDRPRTMTSRLIFAWLFVTLALGWGVWKSVRKSMPLFHGADALQTPAKP